MKYTLLKYGIKPCKAYENDAGFDLFLPKPEEIKPHSTKIINTGVCVEIPKGFAGMMVIRSSLSTIGLIIQPCLIDSGYNGEIHIFAYNSSSETLRFKQFERICSLLIFPIFNCKLERAIELEESTRNDKWKGSSGQ